MAASIVTGECGAETIADINNKTMEYIIPCSYSTRGIPLIILYSPADIPLNVLNHPAKTTQVRTYHIFVDFIYFVDR